MNFDYSRRNRVDLRTDDHCVISLAGEIAAEIGGTRSRRYTRAELEECKRHAMIVLLDLKTAWDSSQKLSIGYSRGKANFERDGCYWD
ncbi:hypothetical protein [Devosia elaeis]|uniref:hypothetical protein n=1 Tax=Devosia elaeis TaxID=1770058 RepID=UPI001041EE48|nr:hypothetical protein [Devosia elaeis]